MSPWARHPKVAEALRGLNVSDGTVVGIHGVLYDISDVSHPGGDVFLRSCAGLDVSALFESSHIHHSKAQALLQTVPIVGTYEEPQEAFDYERYRKLRDSMLTRFPTRASRRMGLAERARLYAISVAAILVHLQLVTTDPLRFPSDMLAWASLSGFLNTVLGGYGHNALHRLEPAAAWLDWNGLSTYEWLLEHVVSHHPHVNTERDHDALSMEPFLRWIPQRPRAWIGDAQTNPVAHAVYAVAEIAVAVQGFLGHRTRWRPLLEPSLRAPYWLRVAPCGFLLRVGSHIAFQGWLGGSACLLFTMMFAGYYFALLAHLSHAKVVPFVADFANHQIGNTVDLSTGGLPSDIWLFLDRQVRHHLFPTLDHSKL